MQGGGAGRAAFATRELCKKFFNSPAGSVSWQNEKIERHKKALIITITTI